MENSEKILKRQEMSAKCFLQKEISLSKGKIPDKKKILKKNNTECSVANLGVLIFRL